MNLQSLLGARLAGKGQIRVGLIGAGKFGSMFLAQVPSIPGIEVAVIADLDPERAKAACRTVGWDAARILRRLRAWLWESFLWCKRSSLRNWPKARARANSLTT